MQTEKNCAQQIEERYKSRYDQFIGPDLHEMDHKELLDYITSENMDCCDNTENMTEDDLREAIEQYIFDQQQSILSVEKTVTYCVTLSWGGPADYIEIDFSGRDVEGGRYKFQDWGDGAVKELTVSEAQEWADRLF